MIGPRARLLLGLLLVTTPLYGPAVDPAGDDDERDRFVRDLVAVDDPLFETGRVYESGGDYYVVYESGRQSGLVERPVTERLLEGVAVHLGAALTFDAGRPRDGESGGA